MNTAESRQHQSPLEHRPVKPSRKKRKKERVIIDIREKLKKNKEKEIEKKEDEKLQKLDMETHDSKPLPPTGDEKQEPELSHQDEMFKSKDFQKISQTTIKNLQETMHELQVPDEMYSDIFKNIYNKIDKTRAFDKDFIREVVEHEVGKIQPNKRETTRTGAHKILKEKLSTEEISFIRENEQIWQSLSDNDVPKLLKNMALAMGNLEKRLIKEKKLTSTGKLKKNPWYKRMFRMKNKVAESNDYKKLQAFKKIYPELKAKLVQKPGQMMY